MSERTTVRRRLLAAVSTIAFVGMLSVGAAEPALAADYPSWSDVQAARASESRTQALITKIKGHIAGLEQQAAAAASLAETRGAELEAADTAFQNAAQKVVELEAQAAEAEEEAAESRRAAGRVVAQMSRGTGGDLTATLLGEARTGADTDGMLKSLSYASKVNGVLQDTYGRAVNQQRNAESLADQAAEARTVREELRVAAEEAMVAAQEASAAADAAVQQGLVEREQLEAQLVVLVERREVTEADYMTGEAKRKEQERLERERLAELERIRQAEAAKNNAGSGGGGGGGGSAPPPAASGWVKPSSGRITSAFGYRLHPTAGTWRLHGGLDYAGGCGTPIYAASAGTVVYSGWYGTYGNWILIQHANGVQTGYAHIPNGGRLVGAGQQVGAGQRIASQGTTGASTGCHLHYEVRINGVQNDPVPFMRARGIYF